MATEKECQRRTDPNRLVREGTSQAQRFPEALDPSYASVDERMPEHDIAFARRYSAYLRFHDLNNVEVDDWKRFFGQDPAVRLAGAAIENVDAYRVRLKACFDQLKEQSETSVTAELKTSLGCMFSDVGTLARELDRLKEELLEEVNLKATLQNLVRSRLAPAFRKLVGYYRGGVKLELIDDTADSEIVIFEATPEKFSAICESPFSADWITDGSTSWTDFLTAVAADESVYGTPDETARFSHVANHNLFTSLFDTFLKAYARTVGDARAAIEQNLGGRNDHQPHFGLFLAFLQLNEFSRSQMNTLTRRHLDFYYRQVLKLKEKPSEPNHLHLLFELAKNRDSALLKAGTTFQGKDGNGKAVQYALNEDFVANRAGVAELKSVHHSLSADEKRLYAYPAANSADGFGTPLTTPDGQWHPFSGMTADNNLATIGFAIASHFLLLGEGNRKIVVKLSFAEKKLSQADLCDSFDFFLTGEKGWMQATVDNGTPSSSPSAKIDILLSIDGSMHPVVPLTAELHGADLPEGLPMLKAVLKQASGESRPLAELQELQLKPADSKIDISVGYIDDDEPDGNGLKNLVVHNKFGEIKTDKPFQPFGAMPEDDDYLIIGSDELFQKQGARFQLRVVWKGLPFWSGDIDFDWVNEFYPKAGLTLLKNGSWPMSNDLEGIRLFRWLRSDVSIPASRVKLDETALTDMHFDKRAYTLDSRRGFLRLSLTGDFGHRLYPLTLSSHLMLKAKGAATVPDRMALWKQERDKLYTRQNNRWVPKDPRNFTEQYIRAFSQSLPVEPYTPVIESLTLSYTATVSLSRTSMFWLTPFGSRAMEPDRNQPLLAPFRFEGELYIGIRNLVAGRNLSLLFQLAEGSASPTVTKPDNHVQWSWLGANEWIGFKNTELSDDTGQLTRSGIIRFSVPAEATNDDSLIRPYGLHWLRAVVAEKPEAVCRIISVDAQAAKATLTKSEAPVETGSVQLPAGTVTKPVTPDVSVKSVKQPYATFGGRPAEDSGAFYTRVSERLRHKNRAITLWDYERMVLDAFPQIYKVKCLNHTRYEPSETGIGIYRELAPGHVTVVTIPNLRNHNAVDTLRPYTNLGELDLIRKFLERHVSGVISLHVENPIFESIQTGFRVKFMPGTDEAFHLDLLRQELVRHLSPWAFEEGRDISFGGKIHKSSLIDFVEERPYVDYVTDFRLYHIDGEMKKSGDTDEAVASMPLSILVSVPSGEHMVTAIAESETTVTKSGC
ncbi:MAG: hypothetical protein HGB00_05730 [Chlorobiaceae bacterium]|nr:hypothetical protein [Chlorobiaceae bacterium]